MKLISILKKKCTICGNKCDEIRSLTSTGYLKEWCCLCTDKRIGLFSIECNRCMQ